MPGRRLADGRIFLILAAIITCGNISKNIWEIPKSYSKRELDVLLKTGKVAMNRFEDAYRVDLVDEATGQWKFSDQYSDQQQFSNFGGSALDPAIPRPQPAPRPEPAILGDGEIPDPCECINCQQVRLT